MSFPALFLACQAVANLPLVDDDEFGEDWPWSDPAELNIEWVLYRSEGAGLVFGVRSVEVNS